MNTKKRKSIASKIAALVIAMVVISNLVCIAICIKAAREQISTAVQNNMLTMAETYSSTIDGVQQLQEGEPVSYERYSQVLAGVQVKGMDSSYIYLVDEDGTMLYHPTEDKVGQPVENEVVKGLVAELEAGNRPDPAVVEYNFKGTVKYAAYAITPHNCIVVVSADESDALAGIHKATGVASGVAVFMVIAAAVIAVIISRSIARPLVKVSEMVHQVSEGNLKVDLSDMKDSNDEIGLIVESVKEMSESLTEIVDSIREKSSTMAKQSSELNVTSEQTLQANNEISKAIEDVAEGSTSMASSITSINDNLEHMSDETNTIDSSVVDIRAQALDVKERSASMSEKMLEMQGSSAKMADGISYITERIQKVNEVVGKVGDIISVIEEISGQTNLLSLNASIEAARAGEAGKGFAVVADEIRVLSDNTNSELNNIKAIITELVKACEECVSASDVVVSDNKTQQEEIDAVLSEFSALDSQIELTAQKADEIKKLVAEMVSLNTNITQSSDGLTDVSSANAAASEEVTANIQELNAMMNGVANIANQIDEHTRHMTDALSFFK